MVEEGNKAIEPRIKIYNQLSSELTSTIIEDITRGMTGKRKYIPSKYFYDDTGSRLFEEICSLPEYYLTRTEILILERVAPFILGPFSRLDLVEMGPGSEEKVSRLIKASSRRDGEGLRYIAFDVSESALANAARSLSSQFSGIQVIGYVADFTNNLHKLPERENTLFILFGSTVGNFTNEEMAMLFLNISNAMKPGDRFLLGLDMIKDPAVLEAAYNDSRGITAEFNKNILNVINREAKADFNPDDFDHFAFYHEEREQVEMHLIAKRPVTVKLRNFPFTANIEKGESILTEISRKFSRESLEAVMPSCGMEIQAWHTDAREWFALVEFVKGNKTCQKPFKV